MSSPIATTKERILDAAEALMLTKSFHSVALNEILSAVNVPKGRRLSPIRFFSHFLDDRSKHSERIQQVTP